MTGSKRVVVLASNSFSGAHLVDLLVAEGYEVAGISRSPEYPDCMLAYKRRRGAPFTFHRLDINRDLAAILDLVDALKAAYVVNFAAQGEVGSSFTHPMDHMRTNALGMAALAEGLRQRPFIERYVHISTPEVYGACLDPVPESTTYRPSSPYAASKASADLFNFVLHRTYGFPVVTIRATNVYGPHQQLYRIIPRAIIYARLGRKLPLQGGGLARKSYIHIGDVSRGELAAMLKGRPGEIYHLSPDGEAIAIRDLVQAVCDAVGVAFDDLVEIVPDRPGQDAVYLIDSTKARQELGWRPEIGFAAGIREMVEWIDREWETIKTLPSSYEHKP